MTAALRVRGDRMRVHLVGVQPGSAEGPTVGSCAMVVGDRDDGATVVEFRDDRGALLYAYRASDWLAGADRCVEQREPFVLHAGTGTALPYAGLPSLVEWVRSLNDTEPESLPSLPAREGEPESAPLTAPRHWGSFVAAHEAEQPADSLPAATGGWAGSEQRNPANAPLRAAYEGVLRAEVHAAEAGFPLVDRGSIAASVRRLYTAREVIAALDEAGLFRRPE